MHSTAALDELKLTLQSHFGDGLVLVVGSGLSCSEGLPGMWQLQQSLRSRIPTIVRGAELALWQSIDSILDLEGLEAALIKHPPTPLLEAAIMEVTRDLILPMEAKIISEAVTGGREIRFTRLLPHLLKPSTGIPVVTTNYDRLIEFGAEAAGLGVDTMFVGNMCGQLNEAESRFSFCRSGSLKGKLVRFSYQNRVLLYKPHGSLDWYQKGTQPIRSSFDLPLSRLIITPGLNKFRNGYESPFDRHRERANSAIDKAARFLVIGYGFNDDHLETHLTPKIRAGVPTVLLTRTITPNAMKLVKKHSTFLALEKDSRAGQSGTHVVRGTKETYIPNLQLWDLKDFVAEVLEP
jgi:SIR2-like domain